MFDDELSAARELGKKGHQRAAGALCGVIIERHFASVAGNHSLKIGKKNPTIADYNEEFKKASVYDATTWRFVQFLADIRNIAAHKKDKEPTDAQIEDLLNGTDKILKTIF